MTCRLLVYPEMVWAVTYVFIILYKLTSVILETWHFNKKPLKCRPLLSTRCFCMACLPLCSKTCIKSTKFWSWKTVMMHYFDCLCRNALLMQTERKKGRFFLLVSGLWRFAWRKLDVEVVLSSCEAGLMYCQPQKRLWHRLIEVKWSFS